jgi:dolichol-phosphate mannosyltransferase
MAAWIPKYLRWYRFAFGPRLTLPELRAGARRRAVRAS